MKSISWGNADACLVRMAVFSLKFVATPNPFIKSATVSDLQDAFFEGYGKEIDVSAPIFRAIQVRRKVTKMLEIVNSNTYRVHTRYMDRKLYNQYFQWLVEEFRSGAKAAGFDRDAVSHASYLINLCATNPETMEKSRIAFDRRYPALPRRARIP